MFFGLKEFQTAREFFEYTCNLPGANFNSIQREAIKVWENRSSDLVREEWGAFQVFDKNYKFYFKSDEAIEEFENQLNDKFKEEGYPIKIMLQRIQVSIRPYKIPTQTFEVIVLDNSKSEAQDPLIDWMIENSQELK